VIREPLPLPRPRRELPEPTARHRRSQRARVAQFCELSAAGDDRGAVLLLAVFFAVFAVAMLYALVGTAKVVLLRERLQDAADVAVMASAISSARCMNLLVLINIVMAVLLAILITLKLVEALATIGILFAAALVWPTGGASLSLIPPLKVVRADVEAAYRMVKPPVDTALVTLHRTADAVKLAGPVLAELAAAKSGEFARHVVKARLTLPSRVSLPVEDDDYRVLCERAGGVPAQLARQALGSIGNSAAASALFDELGSELEDMAESFAEWFCGEPGSSPPAFTRTENRVLPRMPETIACEEEELRFDLPSARHAAGARSAACERSQHAEAQALPDSKTGACRRGADCSVRGPYEERARRARDECAPTRLPLPTSFTYQLRSARVEYVWSGKSWQRQEPRYEVVSLRRDEPRPPCGSGTFGAPTVAEGYNTVVRHGHDVREVLPVCSTERAPSPFEPGVSPGDKRSVRFTEVSHILGCTVRETVRIQVGDADPGTSGGSSRSPKRVERDVSLGDEAFQIRAVVLGHTLPAGGAFAWRSGIGLGLGTRWRT
jgi:hypothetical protein